MSPTYRVWSAMRERCANPGTARWDRYGGRGIRVCERWQTFETFLADMGERLPGTTIDRINNDGNYEPGNCRWATPREQANNTSANLPVTVGAETRTVAEWATRSGITSDAIYKRLSRGWDPVQAVTVPIHGRGTRRFGPGIVVLLEGGNSIVVHGPRSRELAGLVAAALARGEG